MFLKYRRETNEKRLHVFDHPAYRPDMASKFLQSLLENSQIQGSHQKQDGTFKNVQDLFHIIVCGF